ncbi:probable protein phosphatase CG10417 [Cylas formicarius]|uniref:probable protein phosphatase CG10417 n=1 Tax=Cylas formicarius TaxID=197179 RepID=UPI0029589393|nr:probable protein phosphatase CG10417 [Cylas formicarius]
MGSYLSEPVTEKVSSDDSNNILVCGASSMQGWRITQEDAHNCILDFDENTSLFAVYDGHGGHEVAQYCAQKLPNFIKATNAYKSGNIEQSLIEGFLGFDKSITNAEVISVLKEIAGDREVEEECSDEEENFQNLYEEASMPIEKVMEKYANSVKPSLKTIKKVDLYSKSKMITDMPGVSNVNFQKGESSEINETGDDFNGSAGSSNVCQLVNTDKTDEIEGPNKIEAEISSISESNGSIPEIKITRPDNSNSPKVPLKQKNLETSEKSDVNGDINEVVDKNGVMSSKSTKAPPNKIKGKSPRKAEPKDMLNTRPKRNANQLYKKLLNFGSDSEDETEDDEDKTFVGPNDDSDDSDVEGVNTSIEDEHSDEESSDDVAEEEIDDEEDEEEAEDEDELEFAKNMKEEPGSDSGCTAVIALLRGSELYVANAGDSRCVVCRNGKAVEMSFDHKPEDEPERDRIVKAGGKVTADGRVNGGLNLSRAIGDHAYKQNQELSNREQMITALPDVKHLTISPSEDEFMVLACDGIWNFMSSQEVVDFVKKKLEDNPAKISRICEEMFDHCLAPNTMGDGTGCDNMTAIIVKFNPGLRKRASSSEPERTDSKRTKTDTIGETRTPETEGNSQETNISSSAAT